MRGPETLPSQKNGKWKDSLGCLVLLSGTVLRITAILARSNKMVEGLVVSVHSSCAHIHGEWMYCSTHS